MATIHKLTDLKIESAINKVKRQAKEGFSKNLLLGDGSGLYVQVSKTGAASFIFRYMRAGKPLSIGLGAYPTTTLKGARGKAQTQRDLLSNGQDPVSAKHEQDRQARLHLATQRTFEPCALAYIEMRRPSWKSKKHAKQWTSTLRKYAFPKIGSRPVAQIYLEDITAILSPIWVKKHETATRVRGRIESILDWATVQEWRAGSNPARWGGNLEHLLPNKIAGDEDNHLPAMPYDKVSAFIQRLVKQEGMARWALEFTILTCARTDQTLGATWNEFDLDKRMWTIPAERMKTPREHRVPLSGRAIEILESVRPFSSPTYVFVGSRSLKKKGPTRPLSNMSMTAVLRRMEIPQGYATVHGFRSSFRTWVGECTSHEYDVAENALAHKLKNKTEASYLRADYWAKRMRLMQDWAEYCSSQGHNEVPMGVPQLPAQKVLVV